MNAITIQVDYDHKNMHESLQCFVISSKLETKFELNPYQYLILLL